MKLITLVLLTVSLNAYADSMCPQFRGLWIGDCNGHRVTIAIQQIDCDKFLFNESYVNVTPQYFTLDKPTFYKVKLQGGIIEKKTRLAVLDSSAKRLQLLQTLTREDEPGTQVTQYTFKINDDGTLDNAFRSVNMLDETTFEDVCTNLPRVK
jgi:hypothetical protein